MARQKNKRRMTLSEHLALRAQAAEEAKAREEERTAHIQTLKELDKQTMCMCPACMKLRRQSPPPSFFT